MRLMKRVHVLNVANHDGMKLLNSVHVLVACTVDYPSALYAAVGEHKLDLFQARDYL